MAIECAQDLGFHLGLQAIMSSYNSMVGGAAASDGGGDSIFDVVRRKLGKVQDVLTGMAAPLKRRSMYEELPEHLWPPAVPEAIEMSHFVQRGEGHTFVPCQLSNPTWCDYCGDFIWGLYKQCTRCQTCQYTCHQHCVPAVTLNCKSIQDDSVAVVASATSASSQASNHPGSSSAGYHGNQRQISPRPPTSSSQPRPRLEPSRSLGQLSPGPGVAARLVPTVQLDQPHHPLMQDAPGGVRVVAASPLCSQSNNQKHLTRSASEGYVSSSSHNNKAAVQQASPSHDSTSPPHPPHTSSPSTPHHSTNSDSCASPSSPARRPDTPPPSPGEVRRSSLSHQQQHTPSPSRDLKADTAGVPREGETTASSEVPTEKDETDSGYRSGTIPEDKLPPVPSQATLDRQELKRKITKYNHFVPAASFEMTEKESFQGFVKVTMNLIRPITMELGARPPSIYELLTREHIVEENTQHVAFYMPRDTHKSLHITSDTTTKEVVTSLLKKFHILDHPRKFAMYDQEFNDKNKLVRLRRLNDKDCPLRAILDWDPERIHNYRLVLQENETGEIVWDAFSLPELNNFMRVLDREEKETIVELRHKYAYMRQYMERRLAELRGEKRKSKA